MESGFDQAMGCRIVGGALRMAKKKKKLSKSGKM